MADQKTQLPVPSASDVQKFKSKAGSTTSLMGGAGLPVPSSEDIKKFKSAEAPIEKKKPTALPSPSEKPAVSSVAGLRPMVPSSASKSAETKPIAKAEPKPIAKPAAKQAPAQQESMSVISGQSQGKLLIPEPMQKVPAVTKTITTYKDVPVVKSDKNLALDPKLMLKAIFKNEKGTLGKTTSIKASGGMKNTASGTYQMTDETKRDVFNRNKEFQKQFGNYNSFLKEFNKNASLEYEAALSHMSDLVDQYGKYALAAWYSPTHAAQAAKGNVKALDVVPRRDAGNKLTVRRYYNDALAELKRISKEVIGKNDVVKVPVSKKTVTEKAIEVPSLERFDVTNKNWYPTPTKENVDVLAKNTLQKSKDVASNIKLFNSDAQALAQDVSRFNALAKANPRDPNLPVLQKQLQQRQLEVENKHKALEGDIKSIDEAKMEINRQAIANYQNKAKQGGWGGFTWNKIIEGLGSVQRGMQEQAAIWSTLGAQTLDLFGIETEELKKKPWLLAGGGDMYRREKVREYQEKTKAYNEDLKLDSTTPEYMQELEKSSSWAKALGAISSSVPIAMTGGTPAMMMQGMGAFYQEVENDAVLKDLPRGEMDVVAIPIGIGSAWLEETGLKTILGKGVGPVAKILTKVFKKIPNNAAMELIEKTFKEVAESEAGKIAKKVGDTTVGKVVKRAATGALGEAETEPEQGALEDAVKTIYNWSKDNEAFKVAKFGTDEYNEKRAEEAKLGAMGSLILGGPVMVAQAALSGKKVSDDDFVAMRDLLNDPEHIVLTRAKLATDVVDEKITPAQAKQQVATDNKTREILNSIPTDLPVKAQREAFQILWANAKLKQELDDMSKSIAGKDPNLVTGVTNKMKEVEAKIEANNKQLSKISENAFQEQTTSQVSVQPEAGTGLQVAEGEPQAKPQGTTQEGQGQEVARNESTVDNTIAADYLLTGGLNTIRSTDYLLKGIAGVFGKAGKLIDNIRNKYAKELSDNNLVDINNFLGTDTYDKIVSEIRDAIKQSYGENADIESIFNEVLQYPTGMPNRIGNNIESRIAALEGQGQEVVTEEAPIATVDVTTPTKFEEGQMPEMSADQIDWEASGMGTQQEAIDMFGGINDITVVELQGKNDQGQYVGRVRVLGQDTSKEGVLVFKDPNAPAQAEEVVTEQVEEKTPEQTKIESVKKLLSDKGVYPINTRVNGLLALAESKPGEVTPEDVQSVVKVNNTKAKSIASALNRQAKQEAKAAEAKAKLEEERKPKPKEEKPTAEVTEAAAIAGVSPTGLWSMYQINKKVFGLDNKQALASAIVMDRIIGTMARRAGTTKEEIMKTIQFKKAEQSPVAEEKVVTPDATTEVTEESLVTPDATAEVTVVEETPKQRKPRAPKKPAFENVEITETIEPTTPEEEAYVEDQSAQPILWTKIPAKKGDPKIAARNKTIMQAAQDLLAGKITNEQYRAIVQKESPIVPIEQFFDPATQKEIDKALSKDKVGLVGSPTEKGITFTDSKGEQFEITSDEVGLRLDIPAFINNNAWVVTVHGDVTNKKTGKKTKDKAISYDSVARITGVKFDFSPTQAIAVATKKQDKVPFLKMRGKMAPIEGATMDERAENAKKMVAEIQNDPAWTQIGSNPFKHSGFFNRSTGNPILAADEVLQIGGLVFAKNVKETTWDNPIFEVKGERGGPKPTDAAGKNVLFQDGKGAVALASDGTTIIYALTDPNVSTPLHEMAHVFESYLTNAERKSILSWTGQKEWNTETSEKFARGFENWLATGKAPNTGLTKIFEQFKEWLTDIYNGIKDSDIDLKLNPAMEKIYKDMVSEKGKQRKAPSVKKILGQAPTKTTITVDESKELARRMKELDKVTEASIKKGIKIGTKEADAIKNNAIDYIKSLGQKGKLTPSQTRALLNGLKSNLANPVIRDRVFARAKRIIDNANYAKSVEDANATRERIKTLLSADKKKPRTNRIAGSVANMATNFARLSPKMVDDIDLYLERANEVLAAIRNPKITDMDVTGRIAADIAAVNEYAKSEFDKQEEARKEEMFAQYEYLVEAGVLDPSMSLKDINKVIAEINKGDKVDNKKLKEQGTVFFRMLFNDYAGIIKKMLSGTDPITGEPTNISEGDKELVRRFININPDLVNNFMDMFNMANAAQEFITNGIIDNMEVMIRHAKGKQEVKNDADNPKMRGYKAILPWLANIAKIPLVTNIINTKIAPVQEYLRNVFRGETNAAKFEKNSGFTDIVNGSTKALGISDATNKSYAETFDKKKPNGKKFFDITNVFERGIFADLFRTTPGSVEENRAEFVRKKEQLELTIEEKRNSDKKSDNLEAEELQKAYDKIVEGSKDINDVMSKMAPENVDGVMWWINKWDEYFDQIDRVSKSLYNTTLERQNNYTPEGWVKVADKTTQNDDAVSRSFNKMNMSYLDTRRAGTLLKYNGNPGLPKNENTGEVTHVKSYHFDINNSESFGNTLKDVYTAPGIVQYMAYTNSPDFATIIPDKKTRQNLQEKLAFAINSLKDSEIDISPDFIKDYNKAMRKFVDISRAQALVSVKTPILQTVPVVAGTMFDLMNDQAAFWQGVGIAGNMNFHEALNKSGYGIAVRGLEAIAAMDAAEKRITESNGVDLNLFSNIAKLGNMELKWMLSKPDIIAARQAWASYYVHKLKKMGINTSNIDWNTHEFNEEAANYAERKTNSKLNQNIQELSGKVFASRSQTNRALRNTFLNFASFAYNMKYRFWTDLVVLGSKNSNTTDKADAAKDIVRTIGEGAFYIYLGSILSYWFKQGIYQAIGYDEPEEDKKKAEEYLNLSMLTRGLTDLFSPMPGIGDLLFVKGVNSALDLAFGEQEEEAPNKEKLFYVKARPEVEKQFRLYEPPEKTESETYLNLIGGMSSIFGKNMYDVYKTASLIAEGEPLGIGDKKIEYTDKYDNKIEFSNKEKEMMKIPFIAQTLGTIGLGFRDQAEAARKVRSSLEKRAKKRTAASKKEKLFYVKKAE